MEPFTFSEVRGFRLRLFKTGVKCLMSLWKRGGGFSLRLDESDLAVNTSAARTVIVTAADWEVLHDCSRKVD